MARSGSERARRSVAKRRELAREAGLCYTCCKTRPRAGLTVCDACNVAAAERKRRGRAKQQESAVLHSIVTAHERAGDLAQNNRLYADAAYHYQDALTVAAISVPDRLRISEKLSVALFLSGDIHAGENRTVRELPPHTESMMDKARTLGMLHQRVREMGAALRNVEALPLISEMLEIARSMQNPYFSKMANLRMAASLNRIGRHSEAARFLAVAGDIAPNDDVALRVHYFLESGMVAEYRGDAARSYDFFYKAVAAAEEDADVYRVTVVWECFGLCALSFGDTELAKTSLERALFIARRNHVTWRTEQMMLLYAKVLTIMGQYDLAYDYLCEALIYDSDIPLVNGLLVDVGIPLALRKKDDAALSKCARTEMIARVFKSGKPDDIVGVATAFAALYVATNQQKKARAVLSQAAQVIESIPAWNAWDLALAQARWSLTAELPKARALLERRLNETHTAVSEGFLLLFDALVACRRKDEGAARHLADKAADLFTSIHWHLYADEARSIAGSDMRTAKARNGAQMRAFSGLPAALSPREQQVAELVLKGFTNKEIAAQLEISKYTVDSHVTSIMNRLGLRSRYQIADALNQS